MILAVTYRLWYDIMEFPDTYYSAICRNVVVILLDTLLERVFHDICETDGEGTRREAPKEAVAAVWGLMEFM